MAPKIVENGNFFVNIWP